MAQQTETRPTPDRIMRYFFGHVPTQAVVAAIDLDLFTRIHDGVTTAEALAEATGASLRGVTALADAMCGLELLEKRAGGYALTPESESYLVRSARGYLGGMATQVNLAWDGWRELPRAVRTGQGVGNAVESDEDRGSFFAQWVDTLFNLNHPAAQVAATRLGASGQRVLDIGAGSGVWGLAFATRHQNVTVTAVDREVVVDQVTEPFARRHGVDENYRFLKGNFRDLELGNGYDVAILGHILHSEGPERSRRLLSRLHTALKPGGVLLVAEMIPDDDRSKDTFALLFGLNMLLHTEQGSVFTRPDLEGMAREAGFGRTEWIDAPARYPLMAAFR